QRQDKPTGISVKLESPSGVATRMELPYCLLCGEETITCGHEYYTCGGGYASLRNSKPSGLPER
ncbi:unnamed protein product, partial [marine sediment metagenome]